MGIGAGVVLLVGLTVRVLGRRGGGGGGSWADAAPSGEI